MAFPIRLKTTSPVIARMKLFKIIAQSLHCNNTTMMATINF